METPTTRFSNTTTIVTGGTRNIGASISRVLAERGANVAMVYRDVNNSAEADAFARELISSNSNRGNRVIAIQADMADPASPAQIIEETRAKMGVDKINIIGLSNTFPRRCYPISLLPIDNVKIVLPFPLFSLPSCTVTEADQLHHEDPNFLNMLYLPL